MTVDVNGVRVKGPKLTPTGRTAAATAARKRQAAERHAREVAERVEELPAAVLAALLITLVDEAERRKAAA